jgi:outer membrane biosynthesis protein TonB
MRDYVLAIIVAAAGGAGLYFMPANGEGAELPHTDAIEQAAEDAVDEIGALIEGAMENDDPVPPGEPEPEPEPEPQPEPDPQPEPEPEPDPNGDGGDGPVEG